MDFISMSPPVILSFVKAAAESAVIAGIDTGLIIQVCLVITTVAGVFWGLKEKRQASKQGSQTIEKNTFDQLVEENRLLINKLRLMRKDQDKWLTLRLIVLGLPNIDGTEIIKKVEEVADAVSSNEE
jgi:hypothetical protein